MNWLQRPSVYVQLFCLPPICSTPGRELFAKSAFIITSTNRGTWCSIARAADVCVELGDLDTSGRTPSGASAGSRHLGSPSTRQVYPDLAADCGLHVHLVRCPIMHPPVRAGCPRGSVPALLAGAGPQQ